jgi:protein-disulfide isomerase
LAQMLGLTGTPGFIFGEEIVPGAIGLDQMREFVAKIRNRG